MPYFFILERIKTLQTNKIDNIIKLLHIFTLFLLLFYIFVAEKFNLLG